MNEEDIPPPVSTRAGGAAPPQATASGGEAGLIPLHNYTTSSVLLF